MPLIFAAETMGSEQQLQRNCYTQYSWIPKKKKKGISKKIFAELKYEFDFEHEEAEKSLPQLRTVR